tara:strand:- start:235 stop:654 length:420 start_codon:yes stop_codon:yes gene_type:complete
MKKSELIKIIKEEIAVVLENNSDGSFSASERADDYGGSTATGGAQIPTTARGMEDDSSATTDDILKSLQLRLDTIELNEIPRYRQAIERLEAAQEVQTLDAQQGYNLQEYRVVLIDLEKEAKVLKQKIEHSKDYRFARS